MLDRATMELFCSKPCGCPDLSIGHWALFGSNGALTYAKSGDADKLNRTLGIVLNVTLGITTPVVLTGRFLLVVVPNFVWKKSRRALSLLFSVIRAQVMTKNQV